DLLEDDAQQDALEARISEALTHKKQKKGGGGGGGGGC
ncbi:hypothetical protein QU614_25815, partial [Enterobacter hormaechei subsp. xiangfangensis]